MFNRIDSKSGCLWRSAGIPVYQSANYSCTAVGLVLGDLHQGLVIGASLELFFMGAVSIGAYVPPDTIVGGVLATAFAIL